MQKRKAMSMHEHEDALATPQDTNRNRFWWRLLQAAEVCADFAAIYFSFIIAYCIYLSIWDRLLPGGEAYYSKLGLAASVIGVSAYYYVGLYRHQASMMNLLEVREIIRTTFYPFFFLILYSFSTRVLYSRITLFLALALALALVLVERFLFFKLNQFLHVRGINVRPVLIFGAGATGRLLFQSIIHTPKLGYELVGFYDEDAAKRKAFCELHSDKKLCDDILLLTSFDQFLETIKKKKIRDIFLSRPLCQEHCGYLEQLFLVCHKYKVKLHLVPYMHYLFSEQIFFRELNGIPLLSFEENRVRLGESFVKRCFDLLVGSCILLVVSPLMLLIGLLIKLDSEGPVLFKQERIGKDGVPFVIYKFRTMFVETPDFQNSPADPADPRVTRIGRILRKTSLDELPQILNVLQGTMSLVGPRPEMPFIVENEYNDLHRQRLRVKPGITGIWQISTDRTREIHEDISYDLFYIANRSLLLDILILLRTVPALFIMKTF